MTVIDEPDFVDDLDDDKPGDGSTGGTSALDALLSPERLDQLLGDAEAQGLEIDGPGGLLSQLTKAVLERAFDAEMTDHLGYDRGDPAGEGSGNSRNGYYPKTGHVRAEGRPEAPPAAREPRGHGPLVVCPGHVHERHQGASG